VHLRSIIHTDTGLHSLVLRFGRLCVCVVLLLVVVLVLVEIVAPLTLGLHPAPVGTARDAATRNSGNKAV